MPEDGRVLYRKLVNLAHPNYAASRYYSVPVPHSKGLGAAYVYGGWFAPKEAGQVAIQLLWAQLVLLEAFYTTYATELERYDLLWSPGVRELAKDGVFDLTWKDYLGMWRRALTELAKDHDRDTPADVIDIALAMSDYSAEQKELWRKGFEDAMRRQSDQAASHP